MADTSFSPSIQDKINRIEQAVAAITQGAGEDQLQNLREALIGLAALLERNPGIEMAADDLYAAAAVVVLDNPVGARPVARKLRLLAASMERLVARLPRTASRSVETPAVAAECPSPVEIATVPWQSGFLGVLGPRVLCAPVL